MRTLYKFSPVVRDNIDFDKIAADLTCSKPIAIVRDSNGLVDIVIHKSIQFASDSKKRDILFEDALLNIDDNMNIFRDVGDLKYTMINYVSEKKIEDIKSLVKNIRDAKWPDLYKKASEVTVIIPSL